MKTNAQRQAEYRARKRNTVTATVTPATVTPLLANSNTRPPLQSGIVGHPVAVSNEAQVSQVCQCEVLGPEGVGKGGVGKGGGGGPAAPAGLRIAGETVESDQVVRNDAIVKSDQTVRKYQDPKLTPATPAQVDVAADLMRAGAINRDVLSGAGLQSYQALNVGGMKAYGPQAWSALLKVWTAARAQRIIDRAQAVIMQEEPAATTTSDGPLGTTTTQKRETTAPMVAAALAGLVPEVHGKLANGKGGGITVNGNAAIYAPATPGTLDDWTPDGLTP